MSEKRHEINTFANYQNIMVKNSSSSTALFLFFLQNRNLVARVFSFSKMAASEKKTLGQSRSRDQNL